MPGSGHNPQQECHQCRNEKYCGFCHCTERLLAGGLRVDVRRLGKRLAGHKPVRVATQLSIQLDNHAIHLSSHVLRYRGDHCGRRRRRENAVFCLPLDRPLDSAAHLPRIRALGMGRPTGRRKRLARLAGVCGFCRFHRRSQRGGLGRACGRSRHRPSPGTLQPEPPPPPPSRRAIFPSPC